MSNVQEIRVLVSDLHDLIESNILSDETCRFDPVRAKIVLEFARTEIQKSINRTQTD